MSLTRWEGFLDLAAFIAATVALVTVVMTGFWWGLPIWLAMVAAVAARRRVPTASAIAALVISGFALLVPVIAFPIWVMGQVVLFTLALRSARRTVLWVAGAHATVMYIGALVVFKTAPFDPVTLLLPVWSIAVVATALSLRANDNYVQALQAQTQAALSYRESQLAHHIDQERLRIARDLHDSVAHSVSVIAVYAGTAERYLERDPAQARAALAQVRASSRAVIHEVEDILVVLRGQDGDPDRRDVPGVEAVPALLDTTRATGVRVDVDLVPWPDLERPTSVAAYRILQESLTNARKHGRGDVEVTTAIDGATLILTVRNTLAPSRTVGDGFGIRGMTERAVSVHGTLTTSSIDGVFTVEARLPLHPPRRKAPA